VGDLEAEELSMFSGHKVKEWTSTVTAGNSDDPELVSSLPQGKTGGLHFSAGQTEMHLIKTPPDYLLNQVSNKWERFLYQTATNWRCSLVPEEVGYLLVDAASLEQAASEKKWLNLSMFGDAWKM